MHATQLLFMTRVYNETHIHQDDSRLVIANCVYRVYIGRRSIHLEQIGIMECGALCVNYCLIVYVAIL